MKQTQNTVTILRLFLKAEFMIAHQRAMRISFEENRGGIPVIPKYPGKELTAMVDEFNTYYSIT